MRKRGWESTKNLNGDDTYISKKFDSHNLKFWRFWCINADFSYFFVHKAHLEIKFQFFNVRFKFKFYEILLKNFIQLSESKRDSCSLPKRCSSHISLNKNNFAITISTWKKSTNCVVLYLIWLWWFSCDRWMMKIIFWSI